MSTDLNPRESYGQLFFLDNTIESITGDIDIQIGLTESTANLKLNRNVVLARGKTLGLEDHSSPYAISTLSVIDSVLTVVGANGLEVGQILIDDNTIESTSGSTDLVIGVATSTADLVLNRNVLLARGKTLSLEDHSAPHNRVALSMVDGVLVVGTGGLGLRVGDIEIYQDTIESTAGNVDFKIGNTTATANLVIGRNVVMSPGKTIAPAGIKFDITHNHVGEEPGTLCWNPIDDTLNIQHTGGVNQQVGQELYVRVKNSTGSTITSGTVVRFSGVSSARLEVSAFQANGTYPSLYTLGVATQDIADGAQGLITTWGKVHELNTTGGAENWAVGDILYASPTVAGGFTKIKPTAPNNVVPIAAVVVVSATVGEIFVRPTIEQKYSYGRFACTTDASVAATNTAYAITFDSTETSNGVNVGTPTSRLTVDQSGQYQIDVNAQVEIAGNNNSTGTMYMWIRKNGVDVPNSMRRQGQRGEVPSLSFSYNIVLSLAANDYIEVAYAADDTNMRFDATAATAFGPTTAAVLIGVTQIQL